MSKQPRPPDCAAWPTGAHDKWARGLSQRLLCGAAAAVHRIRPVATVWLNRRGEVSHTTLVAQHREHARSAAQHNVSQHSAAERPDHIHAGRQAVRRGRLASRRRSVRVFCPGRFPWASRVHPAATSQGCGRAARYAGRLNADPGGVPLRTGGTETRPDCRPAVEVSPLLQKPICRFLLVLVGGHLFFFFFFFLARQPTYRCPAKLRQPHCSQDRRTDPGRRRLPPDPR